MELSDYLPTEHGVPSSPTVGRDETEEPQEPGVEQAALMARQMRLQSALVEAEREEKAQSLKLKSLKEELLAEEERQEVQNTDSKKH